ncbi:gamma-glutamylcyclotransferase [Alsobacter soli]|uniref:Gamma-glutamylcyclotransferase n=1 Tax=Alsobacter soli TaxID=2109933 RepID=A0A2T1HN18_9HYPH|nr:gamma-glutamylcyclotransferase family protein [Alsobacter soli]PSC02991.1 gamma-glutamylcyclotransferase [Alsobacter soli]
MPLYFAYGSNMDRAAMAQRCPKSTVVGLARLPRHRFIIMADGYASVVRDPRRTVWGVLWDLALSDIPALDRYESLHTGLYTKINQPVVTDGGARRALVYVGRTDRPGKPKPGYLEGVLAAARDAGLPPEYLYELEHGEPAPRKPGTPLFRAPM